MLTEKAVRSLPYNAELLFDLAADVERYPEFLRWWIAARIRKREGDVYYTEQVLGLGPVRIQFSSKTFLHRPERIEVCSEQSPFRQFHLVWKFVPETAGGCQVSLAAKVEFRSRVLEKIVAQVLPTVIGEIISAFEARAYQLAKAA